MMLATLSPHEAYRRVDFDARVATARPDQLVALCYEQLAMALGSAFHAAERDDRQRTSAGLTRALAALTALQLGVDHAAPGAAALLQFYNAVRKAVLDSVPNFDVETLLKVRGDVDDIARALAG